MEKIKHSACKEVQGKSSRCLHLRHVFHHYPRRLLTAKAIRGLLKGISAMLVAIAYSPAYGGDRSWARDQVSGAINYQNVEVATRYTPGPGAAAIPPGSRITHVHASRSYAGNALIATSLCWNGTSRCVSVHGASINTHAFDGLDASQPMYLVHKAKGGHKPRPLPTPVYVKGSVAVWYAR